MSPAATRPWYLPTCVKLAAVVQAHAHAAVPPRDVLGVDAHVKRDPLALELTGDRVAGLLSFARQQALALDQCDLRPEAAQRLRELDADGAAAEDDDAARHLLHAGRVPVGPVVDVRESFDRRDDRIGSRRQHDALGLDLLVADPDATRAFDVRVAAMQVDALVAQPRRLARAGLVVPVRD